MKVLQTVDEFGSIAITIEGDNGYEGVTNISEEESNWVTYQELSQQNILIDAANSDTYILEWKWFESENDTEVSQLQSEYTLNISLTATQTTNE